MCQRLLELRSRPLPVPRPPRARRGDPGRRGGAVAAARVLDDADELSARSRALALATLARAARQLAASAAGAQRAARAPRARAPAPSHRRRAPSGRAPLSALRRRQARAAARCGGEEGGGRDAAGAGRPARQQRLGSPTLQGRRSRANCRRRADATAKRPGSSRRRRRPATTGSTCTSTRACSASAPAVPSASCRTCS